MEFRFYLVDCEVRCAGQDNREVRMITVTVPTAIATAVLANLLILLIGSILFVRWVIKTIGVLREADFGTLFDKSARHSGNEVARAVAGVIATVNEQRELIRKMTAPLQEIAKTLSPSAVEKAIETRAVAIAQTRIDVEVEKRRRAEDQVKGFELLVDGMTGTVAELKEAVRKGLPSGMNPKLVGRVESFCAQRGAGVGAPSRASAGMVR